MIVKPLVSPRFAAQVQLSEALSPAARNFVNSWQEQPETKELLQSTSDKVLVKVSPWDRASSMTHFRISLQGQLSNEDLWVNLSSQETDLQQQNDSLLKIRASACKAIAEAIQTKDRAAKGQFSQFA
jgi:hypothetical protein